MILDDPEHELKKLCKHANITFYKEMLSWPAKARIEDGLWAKHWYKNIHKSN